MTTKTHTPTTSSPAWWRNERVLRALAQIMAGAFTIGLIVYLGGNLRNNMADQGITTSFDFLSQPLSVDIQLSDVTDKAPLWRGLIVGIKNTFALAIVGIPLLTVIGVVVGVARLSTNWLVAKLAALYVEVLRNIPPLLIIVFVHSVAILQLPPKSDPAQVWDLFVFSSFTLSGPSLSAGTNAGIYSIVMALALVAAIALWVRRTRYALQTGHPHHRWRWAIGVVLAVGLVGYLLLDDPYGLSRPVFADRIVTGGISGLGQYFSMLIALSLYTASHVAEIVRGSILAVDKGQTEAANALALTAFQRLRFIVLPQAMRIALPPTINQYLNFVKNTSLAIVVGYTEITALVLQAIGNGRPAPQLIILLMGAYLLFSLTISAVLNLLNRRITLVAR